MARYYIGTAGWSYRDWEGIVYPEAKPRGFHALPFLARYINLMEVNSTFYHTPSAFLCLSWVKKVEPFPDFLFTVKLHRVFTHERSEGTEKDAEDFKKGIEPLLSRERLAALLIQFPWSFIHSPANIEHLETLFRLFAGYPLAVEVRHTSWNRESFFRFLEEHGAGFCNIDQPQLRNCFPPSSIATNPDFSYVRLHGRNARNWFREDAGRDDRYDYLYSQDELTEWIGRIRDLAKKSSRVFIVTNNHYRGQALANALQIKNMLTGEKLDVPLLLLDKYPLLKEIVGRIQNHPLGLFPKKENP